MVKKEADRYSVKVLITSFPSTIDVSRSMVYVLIHPLTREPFYVGRGVKFRWLQHFIDVPKQNNKKRHHIIEDIMKTDNVEIDVLLYQPEDVSIGWLEFNLIHYYGYENLANIGQPPIQPLDFSKLPKVGESCSILLKHL